MDYNSERAMFEAFRCNLPRTTGIVQWMLNSAWPSIYWQLYDWKHAEWWGVNILEYADVSYVCRLPEVALAMQVEPVSGGFLVSMENPSETVAYQNILKARDAYPPARRKTYGAVHPSEGQQRREHCSRGVERPGEKIVNN